MLYYTSISTLNLLKKKYYKNFNKWPKSLLIQKVTPNFKLPSFKKEEIGSLEELLLYISHQNSSFSMRVEQAYCIWIERNTIHRVGRKLGDWRITAHTTLNLIVSFQNLNKSLTQVLRWYTHAHSLQYIPARVDNTLHITHSHTVKPKYSTDHFCEEGKIDHSQ